MTRPVSDRPPTVVVTRPGPKARELMEGLEELGAIVIPYPVMEVAPPEDPIPLDTACAKLATYDYVLFTSGNGVRAVAERVSSWPSPGPKIAVVGEQTAEAVRRQGWPVNLQPERANAEGLLSTLKSRESIGKLRFLFPRAAKGREVLVEGLTTAHAHVDLVVAYRTKAIHHPPDETRGLFLNRTVDLVTFTSGACAEHFLDRMKEAGLAAAARTWPAAVIGPVTRAACEERGLAVAAEAVEPSGLALLAAIRGYLGARG